MCGICGVVHVDRDHPVDRLRLRAMRDVLTHRGPDDAGEYVGEGAALGSRRLAILDLSPRGHMPMITPDGRWVIVYNGEIYNYRSLRGELAKSGWQFRSDTDTEVLLALYVEQGPAMLDRLNGMFAFAIWDTARATLFAARDRLGVKPLCYAVTKDGLYFASEEKALFQAGIEPDFDPGVWEELLCFRYVAGERTPFAAVKRLLPGHYLTYADGELRTNRWWHYEQRIAGARPAVGEADDWFQDVFDSAVEVRRIADVNVGVLLSGGLDSGSVAASLAASAGSGVESFTVRFAEPGFDEGDAARQVAETWGLTVNEITLAGDDLLDRLARASWLNDAPLAHASDIHLNAIAEHAKPLVTVLLSGEGADELLGGYVRYQALRHQTTLRAARPLIAAAAAAPFATHRIRKLDRFLRLPSRATFALFNAADVLPDDLAAIGMQPTGRFPYREQVCAAAAAIFPHDPVRQAMYSDQHTFLCSLLDRNDRMTMGASIECRVPFLDVRLVEGVGGLPTSVVVGRERKGLLRRTIAKRLPVDVRRRSKWGFGVPWSNYLRQVAGLRELTRAMPRSPIVAAGPFDRRRLDAMVARFLAGDDQPAALVRQLVLISAWDEARIDPCAAVAAVDSALAPAVSTTPVTPGRGSGGHNARSSPDFASRARQSRTAPRPPRAPAGPAARAAIDP